MKKSKTPLSKFNTCQQADFPPGEVSPSVSLSTMLLHSPKNLHFSSSLASLAQ